MFNCSYLKKKKNIKFVSENNTKIRTYILKNYQNNSTIIFSNIIKYNIFINPDESW